MKLKPSKLKASAPIYTANGTKRIFLYFDEEIVAIGSINGNNGNVSGMTPRYTNAAIIFFETNYPEYNWQIN